MDTHLSGLNHFGTNDGSQADRQSPLPYLTTDMSSPEPLKQPVYVALWDQIAEALAGFEAESQSIAIIVVALCLA